MGRVESHPFVAADLTAFRCEHPLDDRTVCGKPRAAHRRTSARQTYEVREPVYPRAEDVYAATTSVPGVDVAVDKAGCLVLHVVQPGSYTITNLDSFAAELELARAHAKRFERHPEFYAAGRAPVPPTPPRGKPS